MNSSHSPRILVIDDNRANRLILEKRLGSLGYEITSAEDGARALALLQPTLSGTAEDRGFDLAVLDIMMPDIDGREVLRQVRASLSPADFPVIMATAKDQTEDIVQALEAGANDYVVKPINVPVLRARIETQLSLKRARHALKNAQQSLIHTAKMESVGYLAAGVAHEIRNPLSRIKMGLVAFKRNEVIAADEKLTKALGAMRSACDTADHVVCELMKVATETRPSIEAIDLGAVVDEALLVLGAEIKTQGITVTVDLDESLPKARSGFTELRQVLINILQNAVQAMPEGGELGIRSSLQVIEELPEQEAGRSGNIPRQGDEMLVLNIEDGGPGLPEDQLLAVFDAFYTTKATGSAVGLGLTIAKKTLDLLGGFIFLANREEGGLRVSVVLPKAGGFQTTV